MGFGGGAGLSTSVPCSFGATLPQCCCSLAPSMRGQVRAFGDEVCLCVEGVVHVPDRSLAYVREVVVPFDVCEVPVRVTDSVLANVCEVMVLFEQGLADVHCACVVDSQCRPYDSRLFHCDEL